MKVGDIVRHKVDGDIGLILSVDGICVGCNPVLYNILWCSGEQPGLTYYGLEGENLEVINEGG